MGIFGDTLAFVRDVHVDASRRRLRPEVPTAADDPTEDDRPFHMLMPCALNMRQLISRSEYTARAARRFPSLCLLPLWRWAGGRLPRPENRGTPRSCLSQ